MEIGLGQIKPTDVIFINLHWKNVGATLAEVFGNPDGFEFQNAKPIRGLSKA